MKIVMVTTNDPAGTAIGFRKAIHAASEHRCRVVTTEHRYNFAYEEDLHVPALSDLDELEQVLKDAELFHLHMGVDDDFRVGPWRLGDFFRGRPVIHHHHGEPPFRADPGRFASRERAAGRLALVSTPDLLHGYPDAHWVPNPVAFDEPDYQPAPRARRGAVVVGHSPTRIELKNTDTFERVTARLGADGIVGRVIRNTPHRECLRLKADCDLFFDHMQGYYGVSSLEALSQGVPTFAGLDHWNRRHLEAFCDGEPLPWVVTRNAAALERELRALAHDRDRRLAIGDASRAFIERAWHPRRIVAALDRVYHEAA